VNQASEDHEVVSIYPLDPDTLEQLLNTQRDCVFNWATRDSWPVGVVMSYVWNDGRVWLTAGAHRHRIEAVRRNPKVSIVVTSTGTNLGSGKTATIKGTCIIHEDRETKDWFYPALANRTQVGESAEAFVKRLDSPLRVVLEVVPEKWITYDGAKMGADVAGKLSEASKGPKLSSDAVRLERELQARGLR
jgi:general stress protein 26